MATEFLHATTVLTNNGCLNPQNALGAPDDIWTTNTLQESWDCLWALDVSANPLSAGATHIVIVRVRRSAAGGTDPSLSAIELWRAGVLFSTIATPGVVTDAVGQDFSATFTTDELGGNVADLQIHLVATGGAGATQNRRNIQVDAMTFEAETSVASEDYSHPAAPQVVNIFDSASGVKSVSDSVVEIITVEEGGSGQRAVTGTNTETVTVQDSASGTKSEAAENYAHAADVQVVNVSTLASGYSSVGESVSEIVAVEEDVSGQKACSDSVSKAVNVSISASGTVVLSSATQTAIGISDSASGSGQRKDSIEVTVQVADSASGIAEVINPNEFVLYSDWYEVTTTGLLAFSGTTNTTITVSTQKVGQANRVKEVAEEVSISATASGTKSISTTLSNDVEVYDVVGPVSIIRTGTTNISVEISEFAYGQVISDSQTSTNIGISTIANGSKDTSDYTEASIVIDTTTAAYKSIDNYVIEVIESSVSTLAAINRIATASEAVEIIDDVVTSIARAGSTQSNTEVKTFASGDVVSSGQTSTNINISSSATGTKDAPGNTETIVHISDAVTVNKNVAGIIEETLEISATSVGASVSQSVIQENVAIATSTHGAKSIIGSASEVIAITANSVGMVSHGAGVSEIISISDATLGERATSSTIESTIEVSESASYIIPKDGQGVTQTSVVVSTLTDINTTRNDSIETSVELSEAAVGFISVVGNVIENTSITESAAGVKGVAETTQENIEVFVNTEDTIVRRGATTSAITVEVISSGHVFAVGQAFADINISAFAQGNTTRADDVFDEIVTSVDNQGVKSAYRTTETAIQVSESASYFIPQDGEGIAQANVEIVTVVEWVTARSAKTTGEITVVGAATFTTTRGGEASVLNANIEAVVSGSKAISGTFIETIAVSDDIVSVKHASSPVFETVAVNESAIGESYIPSKGDTSTTVAVSTSASGVVNRSGVTSVFVEADVSLLAQAARQSALSDLIEIVDAVSGFALMKKVEAALSYEKRDIDVQIVNRNNTVQIQEKSPTIEIGMNPHN